MLAAFKGLTSKGVGGRKGKRRGEEKERGRREREGGGKSCMFRGLMLGVKKFSSFFKKIYRADQGWLRHFRSKDHI